MQKKAEWAVVKRFFSFYSRHSLFGLQLYIQTPKITLVLILNFLISFFLTIKNLWSAPHFAPSYLISTIKIVLQWSPLQNLPCIDENTIMEEELKLIETMMSDLIKKILNDDEISGGE